MSKSCDKLESFADGNLSSEEAQEFGKHLAECPRCQAELTVVFQLDQLGHRYLEKHGPVEIPWYVLPRYQWGLAGVALAACAVVVLMVFGHSARPTPVDTAQLWGRTTRTLEARVTYRAADVYRPLQQMMGSEKALPVMGRPPEQVIEALKRRDELAQAAAAYLSAERPEPERAQAALEGLLAKPGEPADVLSDFGVAYYVEGERAEGEKASEQYANALRSFNEALRRKPTHVQALWNRGLVYRKLGFPLLAIQDFTMVERIETDAGWKQEAHSKAGELTAGLKRRERWAKAQELGNTLSYPGTKARDEAVQYADVASLRRDFYDAVRSATSSQEVKALLPLAEKLDSQTDGENVLAAYVHHIASEDFSRRAPLVRRYQELMSGKLGNRERDASLGVLLASGEDDLAVGALFVHVTRRAPETFSKYAEVLIKRANAIPDPWFKMIARLNEAEVARRKGNYAGATSILEDALASCMKARVFYRCVDIENELSYDLSSLFRLDEAENHARNGLNLAQQTYQWDKETLLLQALGNVYRERFDTTLGRAYFGEALLMLDKDDLDGARNIHQNLAHLALQDLRLDEARAEVDKVIDLWERYPDHPLTVHGAEALVDVARTHPSSRDAEALKQALTHGQPETVGERAYAKFLLGRFTLETDAVQGRQLLSQAIREAEPVHDDLWAKHAKAYSYTSLIFDEAKQRDFEAALRRFGEELGFEVPGRCVLALTEDTERSLLLVRGAGGELLTDYQEARTERLPAHGLGGIVPEQMKAALRSCARVDALVRPPLQGRTGLLPAEIAWSYRTRATPLPPPDGTPKCLTVSEVQYDIRRNMKRLSWSPTPCPGESIELKDLEATPSRVLDRMRYATDIDVATHAIMGPGSNTSFLLLARDTDRADQLYANRIPTAWLQRAPLVVLAACEAGRGTSALHEQDSLPNAFLKAGARGVIAATVVIPAGDSAAFFAGVRKRVRDGIPVSVAVRDEKLEWKRAHKDKDVDWLEGIQVFE